MTKEVLKAVNEAMESLGINYEFMEYKKTPIEYPYFVGEYQEVPLSVESGESETSFELNGFTRGLWSDLESAKERIRDYFDITTGKLLRTKSGAIAIFYLNSLVIPTESAELKRIQVNLLVKEWKGIKS